MQLEKNDQWFKVVFRFRIETSFSEVKFAKIVHVQLKVFP